MSLSLKPTFGQSQQLSYFSCDPTVSDNDHPLQHFLHTFYLIPLDRFAMEFGDFPKKEVEKKSIEQLRTLQWHFNRLTHKHKLIKTRYDKLCFFFRLK